MNQKIKWGILGTSYISEVMAKAISQAENSELVAIASRDLVRAQQFSTTFNIPKAYGDYQSLLNDAAIDAVYIGLPNHLHKEWIIHAAHVQKHILCDKPFVISTDEAYEVIKAVEKANVFCMEGLMYRYHPLITVLKDYLDKKIIGEIKLYNAIYTANIADIANSTAGGCIRNLGCYPVSLIRLLLDAEPIDIVGRGKINSKYNTDSQASVILQFPNDIFAVISVADDIQKNWKLDIIGTKGSIHLIANPWMPGHHNKIIIKMFSEGDEKEIIVTADKHLYSYQIEFANKHIMQQSKNKYDKALLLDSLKNTIVLETWKNQLNKELFMQKNILLKNGMSLWVESFGHVTNPAILLISGAGSQCKLWPDAFCELLAEKGYYVIRYDHRDTGRSSAVNYQTSPYTITDLTKDAIAVLASFDIPSAHIVGFSMGGQIAQFMGAYFPENAKSLTLMGTSTSFKAGFDAFEGKATTDNLSPPREDYVKWATRTVDIEQQSHEERVQDFITSWKFLNGNKVAFDEELYRKIGDDCYTRSPLITPYLNHTFAMQASHEDHIKASRLIKTRTLIIHGKEDPVFGVDHAYSLKNNIQHSELTIIDNMGHNLNTQFFDRVITLIDHHAQLC